MFDIQKIYEIPNYSNYFIKNGQIYSRYRNRPITICKSNQLWLRSDNKIDKGFSLPLLLLDVMGEDFVQMKMQQVKEKYKVDIKKYQDRYFILNTNDPKKSLYNFMRDTFLTPSINESGYYYFPHIGCLHIIKAKSFIRPIKENEVVHHINFQPLDCNLDNLIIMDRKRHQHLHSTLKRYQTLKRQLKKFSKESKFVNYIASLQSSIDDLLNKFNDLDSNLKNVKKSLI